jgi:hypothetical protein
MMLLLLLLLLPLATTTTALNILLPGGTGPVGQLVASKLAAAAASASTKQQQHRVTILTRNAFLAATPGCVSRDFGWVGARFVAKHRPRVALRDWDGGDLLDIVGQDWIGWQSDALARADCVVHLTGGGFTEQRVMACERLVRESLACNPTALHITVNPSDDLLSVLSPGMGSMKRARVARCEAMVAQNLSNHRCIRIDGNTKAETVRDAIIDAIEEWERNRRNRSTSNDKA